MEYNIKKVGVFILDVEGYELNVIKGIMAGDPLPHIFCIENNKINNKELVIELKKIGNYKRIGKYGTNLIFKRV